MIIAALQLFLNRTKMGRAFRATSDDREAAELMGINNRHIYASPWPSPGHRGDRRRRAGRSARRSTRRPGSFNLIYAFEAVIMGGMGSIWGTLLGGVVLGLAQTLGSQAFGAGWGILCGHVVFLIVLAVKPSGFFARTVTA